MNFQYLTCVVLARLLMNDRFRQAIESLQANNVPFELFTDVSVEPTDASWLQAITWARKHDFSHFLAVGGGSVMDTAKAANLSVTYIVLKLHLIDRLRFTSYPEADLYDFINAPVGKGLPITKSLRPLIAGMRALIQPPDVRVIHAFHDQFPQRLVQVLKRQGLRSSTSHPRSSRPVSQAGLCDLPSES